MNYFFKIKKSNLEMKYWYLFTSYVNMKVNNKPDIVEITVIKEYILEDPESIWGNTWTVLAVSLVKTSFSANMSLACPSRMKFSGHKIFMEANVDIAISLCFWIVDWTCWLEKHQPRIWVQFWIKSFRAEHTLWLLSVIMGLKKIWKQLDMLIYRRYTKQNIFNLKLFIFPNECHNNNLTLVRNIT